MNQESLSTKLTRIKDATSSIRATIGVESDVIEEVATATSAKVTSLTDEIALKDAEILRLNEIINQPQESSDIYKVSSIEERDALTDVPENAFCIVYSESEKQLLGIEDYDLQDLYFPSKLDLGMTLSEALTKWNGTTGQTSTTAFSTSFRDETRSITLTISAQVANNRIVISARDQYTMKTLFSKSYVLDTEDTSEHIFKTSKASFHQLPTPVKIQSTKYDADILIIILGQSTINFSGVFQYISGSWNYARLGLYPDLSTIFPETSIYTDSGYANGTFGNITTPVHLDNLNNMMQTLTYAPTALKFDSLSSGDWKVMKLIDWKNLELTSSDLYNMFFSRKVTNFYGEALEGWRPPSLDYIFGQYFAGDTYTEHDIILDLSKIDGSAITSLASTFGECYAKEIKLPKLTSGSLTSVARCFRNTYELEEIDLSGWNTSNVSDFVYLFLSCPKLKRIDMRGWTFGSTSDVPSINALMFDDLPSLEFLDIRDLDFTRSGLNIQANLFLTSIPTGCLIIVKNASVRTKLKSYRSDLTNIKTLAEYQAEGGV